MDMTRCSLGKFLVVPTFVTRRLHICKAARDSSGERWNYLFRRLSCNLHKWPLSRHLGICFWISIRVLVQTKYFLSECSNYSLSLPCMRLDHDSCQVMKFVHMRKTWSLAVMNMGLKVEMNVLKQLVFILLCLYHTCADWVRNIWRYKRWNTFNGFFLNADVIVVSL